MRKLDYAGRDRGPYTRPKENGWDCHILLADPAAPTDCAGCGETIAFGAGYSSTLIVTEVGHYGYRLCPACFGKEREGRRRWESEQAKAI